MLGILLAAAIAAAPSAQPSPQPTPRLKVIVNVRSDSVCTAVRKMAIPIGYVTKRNDQDFAAINHTMINFMERTRGVTSAGAAELRALDSSLDDAEMYNPTNDISAVQVGKIAYAIVQNVTLEDQVMNDSWKKYPKGQFPDVDAMRQRLQNLMDLQRSLANKYLQFSSMYTDNAGQARFQQNAPAFKALLRDTLLGLSSALTDASTQRDPEVLPQASAHDIARDGTVAGVVKELRLQEIAFSSEIVTAGDTCGI